ncbi:ATP12 family chaperone protein [Hellea balneolensis]|uniref:ATP12 family chaperone protein n=1 Tax=Hellea balneolensis TaxID=287478 RepID=UPI0003FA167B|nr:ATP12 family protein [Hellea balneolensis]
MAKKAAKRFYKNVSTAEGEGGWLIQLDGRTLKSPGKLTLLVPTEKCAKLIAAEWDAQDEYIKPETMPVTRLLNVAVEQTPDNREALIAEARKYAGTDALCYREGEVRLYKEHQAVKWDPVLAWAAEQGVALKTTESLIAIEQDKQALNSIADFARSLPDMQLTLFVHLVAVYGSAILAMAVLKSYLKGEEAFELSRLAEIWQIKYWGEDEEAKERTDGIRHEINALCELLED